MSGCDSRTDQRVVDALPCFPLELQIAIFSHVPPNHLFFLRRVSHAWNTMLSNEHLHKAINDQIPYLTSAPDFTSRMKRRMRMARGKPVWVKSFAETFPNWAVELDAGRAAWGFIKFWRGWFVMLHAPTKGQVIESLHASSMSLVIRNLARGVNQDVEVDILALFKRVNPKVYKAWIEDVKVESLVWQVRHKRLQVQDGKVVVGLEASCRRDAQLSDGFYDAHIARFDTDRIVHGSYFFVLDLRTGELIQHVYQPYSPYEYNYPLVLHLSDTHLFTVTRSENIHGILTPFIHSIPGGLRNFRQPARPAYELQTGKKLDYEILYRINAYSIEHEITPMTPHAPEIVITDPEATPSGPTSIYRTEHWQDNSACPAKLTTFDNTGRVWFPYIPDGELSTYLQGKIQDSIPMRDLERSSCGKWCIFSAASPVPPTQEATPTIGAPTLSPVSTLDVDVDSDEDSLEERPVQASEMMTTMLQRLDRYFYALDIQNHSKVNIFIPNSLYDIPDEYDVAREHDLANYDGESGGGTIIIRKFAPNRVDPERPAPRNQGISLKLPFPPSPPNSREYCHRFALPLNITSERSSALWGYLGQDVTDELDNAPENSKQVLNNLYLLPFNSNVEVSEDGHKFRGNGKSIEGWTAVRNGLPEHLSRQPKVSQSGDIFNSIQVKPLFGDDGLVGWGVQYALRDLNSVYREHVWDLWLACYEENWVDGFKMV